MSPKISVVLPVWNGEKYLRAAVDSLLAQSFQDFELIIVDDGSTDGTVGVLESYTDARIQIHRLEHGGIVAALNHAVAVARANWIARQDADDISHPKRLAAQWNALHKRKEAVLSFTDVSLIGAEADLIEHPRFPRTKALLALRLCYQNPIVHSTVILNKAAFAQAGGYRLNERHAEDFALWGRLLELGEFVTIACPLLQLRLHPQSVSRENLERQRALTRAIGVKHCQRFMRLNDEDARRAFAVLTQPQAAGDWSWFLRHCVPRLRWKSAELYAWLGWQTLKQLTARRAT